MSKTKRNWDELKIEEKEAVIKNKYGKELERYKKGEKVDEGELNKYLIDKGNEDKEELKELLQGKY